MAIHTATGEASRVYSISREIIHEVSLNDYFSRLRINRDKSKQQLKSPATQNKHAIPTVRKEHAKGRTNYRELPTTTDKNRQRRQLPTMTDNYRQILFTNNRQELSLIHI